MNLMLAVPKIYAHACFSKGVYVHPMFNRSCYGARLGEQQSPEYAYQRYREPDNL